MNKKSLAPCGVICDLCLAYQRDKNKCAGCNSPGNKPHHCTVCSKKFCAEKKGDSETLCGECAKFPCRKIKNLNKRYKTKYGEDLIKNLRDAVETGLANFIETARKKWTCGSCGGLLCVHRESCLHCGAENPHFPKAE